MGQSRKDQALWAIVLSAPLPEAEEISGFGNITETSMVIYCESGNTYWYNTQTKQVSLANLRIVSDAENRVE